VFDLRFNLILPRALRLRYLRCRVRSVTDSSTTLPSRSSARIRSHGSTTYHCFIPVIGPRVGTVCCGPVFSGSPGPRMSAATDSVPCGGMSAVRTRSIGTSTRGTRSCSSHLRRRTSSPCRARLWTNGSQSSRRSEAENALSRVSALCSGWNRSMAAFCLRQNMTNHLPNPVVRRPGDRAVDLGQPGARMRPGQALLDPFPAPAPHGGGLVRVLQQDPDGPRQLGRTVRRDEPPVL